MFYKKNKKYDYIESIRRYIFPSLVSVIGLCDNNFYGLSGIESFFSNYLNYEYQKTFYKKLTGKDKWLAKKEILKRAKLVLTIDAELNHYVYNVLSLSVKNNNSKYASCIIMDGETGDIEVMTQYPQYDPQNREQKHSELEENSLFYLYPLSITQAYEMGSVIKSFLMIAALNQEVISSSDMIDCYGKKEQFIQGIPLTTWKAHGVISFKDVIKESNNFGVAQVGLLMGEQLYDYYSILGFGKRTGISIGGEHKGILHDPIKWSKRSPISLSFGYEMSATPLQLASAWSVFTNNGRRVIPKILLNQASEYSSFCFKNEAIESGLDILQLDKKKVSYFMRVWGKYLPSSKKIFSNEIELFGKTGTAHSLSNGVYQKGMIENNKYVFVGHCKKGEISKIIVIFVNGASCEKKKYSSQIALPIFLEICHFLDKNS